MIDETVRKEVALEYCRRVNAGNLPSLLRLFAVDVRFEDPVGTPPVIGRTALGAHFARVLAGRAEELPGRPIPAQDGLHVAVPIVATMDYVPVGHDLAAAGLVTPPSEPERGRLRFDLLAVMRLDHEWLISGMRVFWGKSDVSVQM